MKRSKFTDAQIAFILQQAEGGRSRQSLTRRNVVGGNIGENSQLGLCLTASHETTSLMLRPAKLI